jgi:sec-independent protein translocase protein TatA
LPFGIGPLELVIVLFIILLVLGPKRLPGLGRSLGGGLREFKDSLTGDRKDNDTEDDDHRDERPALTAAVEVPEAAPSDDATKRAADKALGRDA